MSKLWQQVTRKQYQALLNERCLPVSENTTLIDIKIEEETVSLRKLCINRNDIVRVLNSRNIKISSSTVCNVFNCYYSQKRPPKKEKIIKKLCGIAKN